MKKTQYRRSRRLKITALAVILLAAALLLSVRISEVTVTGNERYTKEELTQILFPDQWSRNSLFCFFRDRLQEHVQIPFVEDYEIVFQGPGKVEVIVYEKSVVGYVSYMSSYMYFDKDGIIVESANEALPGVPLVTGLKFGQIVLYQKLPLEKEETFRQILNLTQILSIFELKVDRIQYGSYGDITLYLKEIEVLLGSGGNMNDKISELNDMLPHLEGRKGILHLEDYDEMEIRAGYTFEPKS
ncbi:MAG: FtsQ-type POTRA domain-containing protein [Lachnospiraceae bacterium]|jgi:cell division protein FtsQ|nr:FtsQ-type POTRA domain-containing protein [Lachnospiraceae bacterium]